MKIYTEVIFEWHSDKLIEVSSESHEYNGPVAQCGGGGGGSSPPPQDYTEERRILNEQKAETTARRDDIRKYFAQLESFASQDEQIALDQYTHGKATRVDDFLTESYGVGRKRDLQTRASGFESDTSVDFDYKMEDQNRNRVYDQIEAGERLNFKQQQQDFTSSRLEREKAYEDQMTEIADQLYNIQSAYAATT